MSEKPGLFRVRAAYGLLFCAAATGCSQAGWRDALGGMGRHMAGQAQGPQMMSVFKRSYISGVNRICIYDQAGSERVVTIPATAICPLN